MAAFARARERRSAPEAVFSPISRINSAGGFVSSWPWLTEFIHTTLMNIAYGLRCGEAGMSLCRNLRAAASRFRMGFVVNLDQFFHRDMRVDLRCRQARMPEQRLNVAKIGAAFEQVRGKRMAQPVPAY